LSSTKNRKIVGAIAVVLLLLFTALALIGVFSFIEWIIADLVVVLFANLIFRILKRNGS